MKITPDEWLPKIEEAKRNTLSRYGYKNNCILYFILILFVKGLVLLLIL